MLKEEKMNKMNYPALTIASEYEPLADAGAIMYLVTRHMDNFDRVCNLVMVVEVMVVVVMMMMSRTLQVCNAYCNSNSC